MVVIYPMTLDRDVWFFECVMCYSELPMPSATI